MLHYLSDEFLYVNGVIVAIPCFYDMVKVNEECVNQFVLSVILFPSGFCESYILNVILGTEDRPCFVIGNEESIVHIFDVYRGYVFLNVVTIGDLLLYRGSFGQIALHSREPETIEFRVQNEYIVAVYQDGVGAEFRARCLSVIVPHELPFCFGVETLEVFYISEDRIYHSLKNVVVSIYPIHEFFRVFSCIKSHDYF